MIPAPGKQHIFYVPVAGLAEAKKILEVLADHTNFLIAHDLCNDYANVNGLEEFDPDDPIDDPEGSWCEWESDDGDDIHQINIVQAKTKDRLAKG
jgi:hypothetical protein